ncbi:MAG TPA: tRNA (N6-isopentenyl adenosine(37)-C2)-methylthiotransferase MiaB [Phycisphaerae bacterium]|nr:tRNA (N6-isopentenyl adenosine(37)-C2)-methylthiotransferase MiaB [Phycisphaerae bacterium]HRY68518.1 tRNA (N6-isopentenyl adenosine(37)-C2)-methylthiotransferase MiaB [Phycisphaerae bacterium]HSA25566.1 tRNA (N6-isopentenyl adenosine(37)-C2)-methylthiotransferase MiaB [Phycisphaerae bacterium]
MTEKRVYIETMGCQMNVLDSGLVLGQLCALGYRPTDDYRTADLVVLNTCSVRQHAEDKVYSRLGELGQVKRQRPSMILGVIGCMAERDHAGIRERARHVDFLCGPGSLNEVPELLEEVVEARDQGRREVIVALEHDHSRRLPAGRRTLAHDSIEELDLSRFPPDGGSALQSYLRVQRGCDKFCSFCVVPFTRGPERSRPPGHIVEEARRLVGMGAKEITLLGQTVNSYSYEEHGRQVAFAELLQRVHEVPGIERLRFVTSYPGDFTDDILYAMRDLPRVCEYLHLPAQSGSNGVLQRMKRQYTAEGYVELIERARSIVPRLALAGDFIVGFSGETDEEHAETLALIEKIRYKGLFIFKYSERPGTVAERRLPDNVPEEVKQRRHGDVTRLQHAISLAHHRAMIGGEVEVLVEGYSKAAIKAQQAEQCRGEEVSWRRSDQLVGRTRGDDIVVFAGDASLIGGLTTVRITAATALTLHGEAVVPIVPQS